MESKLGIIIQARLGSTRLPGKILLPFQGSTLLEYIINRLKPLGLPIVVATTTNSKDDKLIEFLDAKSIKYIRGDEKNVLDRYIKAAEKYNINTIIRITSDNPFIDIDFLRELIDIYYANINFDYWSFSYENKPTVLTHFGVFAEIVTLRGLKYLAKAYNNDIYKEHVTYGIYMNPNIFQVYLVPKDEQLRPYKNIRLTIDTPEDYENLLYIGNQFNNSESLKFINISNFIIEQPHLLSRMKQIIQQNQK